MNIGNQQLQKKLNREQIINLLRRQGNMSRSQIADETKLGWGSITKYSAELLAEGIVREIGAQKSGGRNSVILGLNPTYKYFIGLDIGSSFIKGMAVDMTGTECAFHREATRWQSDRNTVLEQIFGIVETLLRQAGLQPGQLMAIGCGVAGGVDFETGTVSYAGNFRDFDQMPLSEMVGRHFSVPCFVSNSMIIRLLGVSRSPQVSDRHNVAYISLGTGIGAGIISHGRILVPTSDEHIGDIAHFMVRRDGPQCFCGLHGCLEAIAGARAVLRTIRQRTGEDRLEWAQVKARPDDTAIDDVLTAAGRDIAMALCGIIQFHRPDVIILGGGMTELGDRLIGPIRAAVAEQIPTERFDVAGIVVSEQRNCGSLGATMYAWDNIFHSEREYVNLKLRGTTD